MREKGGGLESCGMTSDTLAHNAWWGGSLSLKLASKHFPSGFSPPSLWLGYPPRHKQVNRSICESPGMICSKILELYRDDGEIFEEYSNNGLCLLPICLHWFPWIGFRMPALGFKERSTFQFALWHRHTSWSYINFLNFTNHPHHLLEYNPSGWT